MKSWQDIGTSQKDPLGTLLFCRVCPFSPYDQSSFLRATHHHLGVETNGVLPNAQTEATCLRWRSGRRSAAAGQTPVALQAGAAVATASSEETSAGIRLVCVESLGIQSCRTSEGTTGPERNLHESVEHIT